MDLAPSPGRCRAARSAHPGRVAGLPEHPHTRRTFLAAAGAAALGGGLLAGCSDPADRIDASDRLVGFIALSQLVTGERDLPVRHAPAYQAALEDAGLRMSPTSLAVAVGFARSGGPFTLDELQRSAAYRRPGGEEAARALAAAWWSGTVTDRDGVATVITYDDALVFRAMPWAVPQATCLGETGAWSKRATATAAAV